MSTTLNATTATGFQVTSDNSGTVQFQSSGTNTMYIDASGNVGIGTTSPFRPLTIQTPTSNYAQRIIASTNTFALIEFINNANNNTDAIIGTSAANTLSFYTNGFNERMRIDSSGNVGIGTSSPNAKLNVVAGDAASATNQVNISGGRTLGGGVYGSAGSILFTNSYWSSGYGAASISGMDSGSSGGFLGFGTTTNGTGTTGTPTERMRIDSSGNVGIGTSSPGNRLHISGASNAVSGVSIQSTGASGRKYTIYSASTGGLYFANDTGGGDQMVLDSSGNVGIGTTSPTAKLDVLTSINLGQNYLNVGYDVGSGGGWIAGYNSTYSTSAIRTVTTGTLSSIWYNSAGLLFYTNSSAAGGTAATERMRIDSSGNVGIGTTSPSSALSVARSSGEAVISITNSGTASSWLTLAPGSAGVGYIHNTGNTSTVFTTNSTERMRIDSSGNLLVGTTLTNLYAQTSGKGLCYRNSASLDVLVTSDNAMILNRTTTTGQIVEFRYSGTAVGGISVTGSATAYNTSSDYRLKHDVEPMTTGLATVSALKPVTYKWNADNSDGEGFIAHELAEVIPLAVTGAKDAVDADGNPIHQGVDYSKIVVHLVAAIQEQQATITALTTRIATLEAK